MNSNIKLLVLAIAFISLSCGKDYDEEILASEEEPVAQQTSETESNEEDENEKTDSSTGEDKDGETSKTEDLDDSNSYDVGFKNSGSDIWGHGLWAAGNKNIDYVFTLEAGKYTVATGYQEWWNTSRPTKITITDNNGLVLSEHKFTLASSDSARLETMELSLDDDSTVTVSISKTGNPDPVLSFIAVIKDSMDKEKESLGYTDGRWYTKWGATYYETSDGKKLSGIAKVDGVYYSFSNAGAMQKSVFAKDGDNTYYFTSDGKMAYGWITKWTHKYYFDENGVMQTGFAKVDGDTYHFTDSGIMQKDIWVDADGYRYYFKSNGKMAVNETITKWLQKYTFDESGHLIK